MSEGENGRVFPFLVDLYAALFSTVAGVRRAGDAALETLVDAQAAVDGLAARGRARAWLIRQFEEGTISWAVVALLMLATAGLMSLFAGFSRS
jgi:hypothetical protein